MDLIYSRLYIPACCRTEDQWLREGYRVRGKPVAQLLSLLDKPHGRRRSPHEPIDPENITRLRDRLEQDR